MLATYTARIAQFRATVSLALATAVDPTDEPDDEDPDALASGLDD